MAKYRAGLPQLWPKLFLTDGGIETTLVFQEGIELPSFAAFPLLDDEDGLGALRRYYARHAAIADSEGVGFILESPTWRANADWGAKLGYGAPELARLNRQGIDLMREVRDAFETAPTPMVISGCVGPRGDGYDPRQLMRAPEAAEYHAAQIETFAATRADMVTALTMTNVAEAIGIVQAAIAAAIPVAVSFTLETDGRLPTGESLREAIETVDDATSRGPAYYMINCAHPTHFAHVLEPGTPWADRLRGLRANASTRSHAELDNAADLDDGDPVALGAAYRDLRRRMPQLTILGGCCGTDHRHVAEICRHCRPSFGPAWRMIAAE